MQYVQRLASRLGRPFVNTSSVPASVPADQAARAKRRILVAASLVTSLSMLDSNIVAVSLPSIARTLGAGFADIEWVISAYLLSFAALLLAAGSYADRHGRKRATLIGLVVFAIASGLCGLARSALMRNLARALQGIMATFAWDTLKMRSVRAICTRRESTTARRSRNEQTTAQSCPTKTLGGFFGKKPSKIRPIFRVGAQERTRTSTVLPAST
jgi:hypothetical protein